MPLQRLEQNPLIVPADVTPSRPDFRVVGVFNAGAARCGDEVVLLLRIAEAPRQIERDWLAAPIHDPQSGEIRVVRVRKDDPDVVFRDQRVFHYRGQFHLTSISHLRAARSRNAIRFAVDRQPALCAEGDLETYGIEDPRVTRIGDDYWITFKAVSPHGICTALAHTRDFRTFERHGVIFCPENLDVVIFPDRFAGGYAAWTRPVGNHGSLPEMWVAHSTDLRHWGAHRPVIAPRPGMWDAGRVGAGTVPVVTEAGWLAIYHGADANDRYCAGAILVDREDPGHVLARSPVPILEPDADYENEGFFGGVVFPGGSVADGDSNLLVYYGAADDKVCAARTTVEALLEHLGDGAGEC